MRDEGGAAHVRRVRVSRADAEIFAGGDRRHRVVRRGAEEPVDILPLQTGVGQGALRRLSDEIQRREPRPYLPEVRLCHPDYRDLASDAQLPSRTKTATGSPSWRTSQRTLVPISTSSGGTPSTRLIMRKPSSRSMRTTLRGSWSRLYRAVVA